ncbi:uncharacterized protein LOC112213588 isoform X2 [Bombus impatiens]|uniref:Uncharacterized protein LOC112213588 isoform X2 n=1 Tax=Bombus impatiens TaxID=132113 RepID=A0A6P8LB01_BOMIM|nr:uncharacterized protein LOC112213588 isoform X2 [Bombus impatiens]
MDRPATNGDHEHRSEEKKERDRLPRASYKQLQRCCEGDARRSLLFSWTPHFAVAMTNFPRIPLGGSRSPTLREEEIKRRCDGIYIFVDLL